jgi:FkbM family methyltransferase
VEAIPDEYDSLISNRPNATCINCAVYNVSDQVVSFDIANEQNLYSGISEHITTHREKVDVDKKTIQIKTKTLLDILNIAKAPKFIEYLSIDTEGSEFLILEAFDFSKYTFGLIDVEHNFEEPNRSNIRNLLERNGYVYIGANEFDDCYRHNEV